MTKEEWLKLRNEQELPIWVYHQCYLEQGGVIKNQAEFEQILFGLITTQRPVVNKDGSGVKQITFNSVIHKTHEYFNKKFEL